jgi:hypothetical protein
MENNEIVTLFKLSLSTCNIKNFKRYLLPYLRIIAYNKIRIDEKNNSFYNLGIIPHSVIVGMKRKTRIERNSVSIYELSVISHHMTIAMKDKDAIKLKILSDLFLLKFISSDHMSIDIESMFLQSVNDDINNVIKSCIELGNIITVCKKYFILTNKQY